MAGISLHQTEPAQGQNSGPVWTGEGPQYLHQDPMSPHMHAQNGFSDSFTSFQETQAGQDSGRGSFSGSSRSPWATELSSSYMKSEEMSRYPSQDSTGAHSQRTNHSSTANSYDHSRSTRMFPSASQMSYHMSSASSDVTGRSNSPENSALFTPTQQMDLPFGFPYPEEDLSGYHRNSTTGISPHAITTPMTAGRSFSLYTTAGDQSFMSLTSGPHTLASQGPVAGDSMFHDPSAIMESPTLWDNENDLLDSRGSSPVLLEDRWTLPPSQMMTSATNSPVEYSPSIEGLSPRNLQDFPDFVELPPCTTNGDRVPRKPVGPRLSKVASDLASRQQPSTGANLVEQDNSARTHYLYHNVTPQADGLYHCPWENKPEANCQHRPEKLKCNYEYDPFPSPCLLFNANHSVCASKFVDSHLKPYKCKVPACKDLQFSSTACLLRHEREAHAMHGHGDKPFLCTYEGCERGVTGNGFPRHWNLRDHMKRVHGDPGQPKSNASGSPPPSVGPTKGKKRKAGESPENALFAEKAIKRVATPPVSVVIRQPQEPKPSLFDCYNEKSKLLMNTVKQLQDPRNVDNMDLLRSAADYLKVMAQTTQRIQSNSTPNLGQNFNQQSG
jgi:hypothetical protein